MQPSDFNQAYKGSSKSLNDMMVGLMVFSIVLYVMTQSGLAMRFMFIKVRALQMILHLPLMRIMFPANVITFIQLLIPTVGFDILEAVLNWEDQGILQFDFQRQEQAGEEIYS